MNATLVWRSIVAAAGLAVASAAGAQDAITLKFAFPFPETHPLWTLGGKVFADKVTQLTNGQVQWEVYPAGQLGKDYPTVLQSSLADIVILAPAYTPEKFPLSSVADLPGNYASSCEASMKVWNVIKPGGQLYDLEYKPFGIHPLFTAFPPPYQIMTTSRAVDSLGDIAGLKLRAIGFSQTEAMNALGAGAGSDPLARGL